MTLKLFACRAVAMVVAAGMFIRVFAGCEGKPPREVVLYSSADSDVLAKVVSAYEASGGAKVLVVGDTEATKTTGLVQRLLIEEDAPRADVWWSSEALGTFTLKKRGLLRPMDSAVVRAAIGDRDAALIGPDGAWVGFAARARVIAFNTKVTGASPKSLGDLAQERFRGRIGMARPQFGTTRTHVAALVGAFGEEAATDILEALKANGLRLYDGNSSVVRAIAEGEIDAGLTDTDDVWAAKENGWPVEMNFEASSEPAVAGSSGWRTSGPLVIPNTVALIKGGPHPEEADRLAAFLLSPEVERLLASSRSRNTPTLPAVASEYPELLVPGPWAVSTSEIVQASEAAAALIERLFPLGG